MATTGSAWLHPVCPKDSGCFERLLRFEVVPDWLCEPLASTPPSLAAGFACLPHSLRLGASRSPPIRSANASPSPQVTPVSASSGGLDVERDGIILWDAGRAPITGTLKPTRASPQDAYTPGASSLLTSIDRRGICRAARWPIAGQQPHVSRAWSCPRSAPPPPRNR